MPGGSPRGCPASPFSGCWDTSTVAPDETPICSAKGCRAEAVWVLAWNNPKLHTPDRRKVWLACDDHVDHLADFLARRSFLLTRSPL